MLLALTLAACSAAGAAPAQDTTQIAHATFRASNADFANPERGFYRAAEADLDALRGDEIAEAFASGYRLIYTRIDLEAFRERDISAPYLAALDAGFATARAGGVKLIVRATYNYPRGETEYHDAQDASLERVLRHISQLRPLLERNEDVIAFVQAGFIGAWGEWHTSSNGLTEPEARTRIRDALLEAIPYRFIQVRYPPYIQAWRPTLPALDDALSGEFRIGFHNDCFLASATDVGTYSEDGHQRATEQRYIAALGDLSVFGGETCNPADDPGATPRTGCSDILEEGALYNLTYLNDGYYRRMFHDAWTRGGCMADVRRLMGYRFALVSASYPTRASRGDGFSVSIVVRNGGWARLYNSRAIEIVLRHAESGAIRRIEVEGADPRTWLPGRETAQTLDLTLPVDLPVGAHEVWLALPDADARLRHDGRFAIRFANADDNAAAQRWSESLAAFALGAVVTIH